MGPAASRPDPHLALEERVARGALLQLPFEQYLPVPVRVDHRLAQPARSRGGELGEFLDAPAEHELHVALGTLGGVRCERLFDIRAQVGLPACAPLEPGACGDRVPEREQAGDGNKL
jgi:hypothetical protein